jgi:ABC-type multidrug transport system ATPase subunit
MINVLTGIEAPTEGTAKFKNFDINEDIEEIRGILGLVPQFDILWDLLTAEEHMKMFCKIKGVPENKIPEVIDS